MLFVFLYLVLYILHTAWHRFFFALVSDFGPWSQHESSKSILKNISANVSVTYNSLSFFSILTVSLNKNTKQHNDGSSEGSTDEKIVVLLAQGSLDTPWFSQMTQNVTTTFPLMLLNSLCALVPSAT